MTKSQIPDWEMLPVIIFNEVMMKIVLESYESLHRCRQVCKSWNERILSNIWESSNNKKIIKIRVEKIWGQLLGQRKSFHLMRNYPTQNG